MLVLTVGDVVATVVEVASLHDGLVVLFDIN